jgi:hypothetical protein
MSWWAVAAVSAVYAVLLCALLTWHSRRLPVQGADGPQRPHAAHGQRPLTIPQFGCTFARKRNLERDRTPSADHRGPPEVVTSHKPRPVRVLVEVRHEGHVKALLPGISRHLPQRASRAATASRQRVRRQGCALSCGDALLPAPSAARWEAESSSPGGRSMNHHRTILVRTESADSPQDAHNSPLKTNTLPRLYAQLRKAVSILSCGQRLAAQSCPG